MLLQGQWKLRALEILDAGIVHIRSAGRIVVDSGGEIDASAATGSIRLAAGEIATADLADGVVTFAKASVFISAEQTGNGLTQSVAHGLAATPAGVLIVPTDTAPATTGAYTAIEGAHTTTNVVVTVTSGKKYKVFAWA
ncbi:MAG: hypothetical protein DDT29_02558 [Dehalococcoidia bacterium]|nr:hypothetical protein [Bacillota bacterium]